MILKVDTFELFASSSVTFIFYKIELVSCFLHRFRKKISREQLRSLKTAWRQPWSSASNCRWKSRWEPRGERFKTSTFSIGAEGKLPASSICGAQTDRLWFTFNWLPNWWFQKFTSYYRPRTWVDGKVKFWLVSVHLSVHTGGVGVP